VFVSNHIDVYYSETISKEFDVSVIIFLNKNHLENDD